MTLDLAKIKSDAEIIASRCDSLLMPLPVKDVLVMLAEIERLRLDNGSLRGSTKRLGEDVSRMQRQLNKNKREIDQLKSDSGALRKDAERYRWMRDHGCPSMESWFYELRSGEMTKDQADSEIDEAMTKDLP